MIIEKEIDANVRPSSGRIEGERIESPALLSRFYEKRDFTPAWSDEQGKLPNADGLLDVISRIYLEGLPSGSYHFKAIRTLLSEARAGRGVDYEKIASLDLLLTDAFLTLGCTFSGGCANPLMTKAEWHTEHNSVDIIAILEKALRENRVEAELERLLPGEDAYARLKRALMAYREIETKGGWPSLPPGPPMKKGDRDHRVPALRKRLSLTGDLEDARPGRYVYDGGLESAVKTFQRRHGLRPDGVTGPLTLKELNVTVRQRIDLIAVNMERLRWCVRGLGRRYILVNIADFSLQAVEDGHRVLSMKAVVGKPYWYTPIFSARMTYMVLNPFWNLPESIAAGEILPKVRKDPRYLENEKIGIIRGWGEDEHEVDIDRIDWRSVTSDNMNFRLRQEPGPKNPLGRIKFMFPNRFNVYLHDTPGRGLFERPVRAFSHGCIRVERPVELAIYLLKDSPEWTREKLAGEISSGKTKEVAVTPTMVHVFYLTAWVDEEGRVQFRDDIYDRDPQIAEALGLQALQERK